MDLRDGDYLDVTIRWPKTEEYDMDEDRMASKAKNKESDEEE